MLCDHLNNCYDENQAQVVPKEIIDEVNMQIIHLNQEQDPYSPSYNTETLKESQILNSERSANVSEPTNPEISTPNNQGNDLN